MELKKIMCHWNVIILTVVVPLISGCGGGGGGGSASLGSLFSPAAGTGAGDSGSGDLLPLLANSGGGESIALAHNPEPTTMLLLGSGMMAMAYLRTKTMKSSSKS